MSGLSLETCLSSLKSYSFNRFGAMSIYQLYRTKIGGHVTLATLTYRKFLRDPVRTVPGNMHVKFEVRNFNRFVAISI